MSERPQSAPDTPMEQAGHWFALMRSGEMSVQETREMRVWLERDPAHRAAYEELQSVWDLAPAIRSDPHILALREAEREAIEPRVDRRRFGPAVYGTIAASAVLAGLLGWWAAGSGLLGRFAAQPTALVQEFHTGIGQRTNITLDDGTLVTLDTDSAIRTQETGRQRLVELSKGRAFFRVAKDPARPFIVSANGKTVTATGTAFDVRSEEGRFEVTLLDGRVTVEEPQGQYWRGRSEDMTAGWRLVAREGADWNVKRIDVGKEIGWINGRLTFENERLVDVIAELNRYSTKQIVLRDKTIANAKVVGGFRAGDISGFVTTMKAYKLVRVVSDTDAEVILGAPKK